MGFISSARRGARPQAFMGLTSNPSKTQPATPPPPPLNQEQLIAKRLEYVETNERRLAAKLIEETNRAAITQKQHQTVLDRVDLLELGVKELASETMWVRATAGCDLMGIATSTPYETMREYRENAGAFSKVKVAEKGERVCLVYPMETVGSEVLMRVKRVDPDTGQLACCWAVIYDGEYRVTDFSMS